MTKSDQRSNKMAKKPKKDTVAPITGVIPRGKDKNE